MAPPAVIELSLDNISGYLAERGLAPGADRTSFELLGGGISNTVVRVQTPDDCMVVKQPLPKLRVAEDWPFDRRRILVERDCMSALAQLLPPTAAPQVRFDDERNYVLGMSCAPAGGEVWKQALMAGRVDSDTPDRAGLLLAQLHERSAARPDILEAFRDQTVLVQGRIDPYHRAAAGAHPDLAPAIEREIERMLGTRVALVHGDYSPKNIVAYPTHILVLDFEVAHFGDPAFDIAFCLTHLVLKGAHFVPRHHDYLACARRFWRAYRAGAGTLAAGAAAEGVVRELGCLLLARIDGKSKIEYITDEPTRAFVRRLGRDLLLSSESDPDAALDWVGAQLDGGRR